MGLDMYLSAGAGESTVEVGYWRKANAVHGWFVDHCADGVDDCEPMRVTRSALESLNDDCEKALAMPAQAPKVLPTRAGSFFGSTEYDDDYREDLEQTKQIIAKALATDYQDFTYHASW